MNKDLTVGNPSTVLWKFCLPLFGSIVFQQLYNIADSWVAGKFIGQNALAAVGNSYEITLIFIAFAFGCNIGCSVLVSQLFGAREYGDVKTAVSTAALSSGLVCLLLMLVGILGCDGPLRRCSPTRRCIWISTSGVCPSYSSITLPRAFSPPLATARRPLSFWRRLP